jgi:eukaryotic-like serine/threonine-protein kinase
MVSSTDIPDLGGQVVGGKYRVDRLIGTGGMGTVWVGIHEALGHKVAIKFIKPAYASHPDARKRFEIEARAAAKLKTKHAVQVYDFGVTDEGIPYIVMEYLEGRSLSELLMEKGPLPGPEVGSIISQAARALAKAHAAGIVHRDLKPDNIFLATNAEDVGEQGYSVKLVDFGIAKIVQEPVDHAVSFPMGGPTQEGAVVGTPNFMSPEQLTVGGAPGTLTDLWSLGACAFTAMTARIPFEGDVLGDIVLKVCVSPLPVPSSYNPKTPPGFDAWFAKACSRDPTKRFQTATELRESLELVCGVDAPRAKVPSMDEVEVQYALRPAPPNPFPLDDDDDLEMPSGMSPRTALLAGLVLGVAVMIGVVGAIAWRQQQLDSGVTDVPPVASSARKSPLPPPSSPPPPGSGASGSDATKGDAGASAATGARVDASK